MYDWHKQQQRRTYEQVSVWLLPQREEERRREEQQRQWEERRRRMETGLTHEERERQRALQNLEENIQRRKANLSMVIVCFIMLFIFLIAFFYIP